MTLDTTNFMHRAFYKFSTKKRSKLGWGGAIMQRATRAIGEVGLGRYDYPKGNLCNWGGVTIQRATRAIAFVHGGIKFQRITKAHGSPPYLKQGCHSTFPETYSPNKEESKKYEIVQACVYHHHHPRKSKKCKILKNECKSMIWRIKRLKVREFASLHVSWFASYKATNP